MEESQFQAKLQELKENAPMGITQTTNDDDGYDCDRCQDSGFIVMNGEAVPCSCTTKKRIKSARINDRFRDVRLDNFEAKCPEHKEAYKNALALVENIDLFLENNWGLFLQGPPSQGKTHLQASIVNGLCIDENYPGIMVNVRELLSEIKDAVGDNRLNQMLNNIKMNEIIALNDVTGGKRQQDTFTEFERGIIYRLVDAVYEENKVLVISGKFNYNWIKDKLGLDIRDRIFEMCGKPIVMKGYNWREKAGKKRDQKVQQMIKAM